jgi:hypothetical protein
MLAAIVAWGALGKVVVSSFAVALVLTYAFTTGVLLVETRDGRRAVGYAAFAACQALVGFGLYVMFSSK